jgi:hypothetical protein
MGVAAGCLPLEVDHPGGPKPRAVSATTSTQSSSFGGSNAWVSRAPPGTGVAVPVRGSYHHAFTARRPDTVRSAVNAPPPGAYTMR